MSGLTVEFQVRNNYRARLIQEDFDFLAEMYGCQPTAEAVSDLLRANSSAAETALSDYVIDAHWLGDEGIEVDETTVGANP